MIYITGDTHGDIARFKSKEVRALRKGDTLIICGDFGFVWDGSDREKRLLRWIGKRRWNTLFVEDTHDNLELLSQYPQAEWCGGQTREISGNLRQICRGEVLEIEGKRIFAFGGGEAEEEMAVARNSQGGELPSPEEIANAWQNLVSVDHKVDYIVTHRPSRKIAHFLLMTSQNANVLDAFLDEVREKCTYTRWFFGQLHKNKRIPPNEMALFTSVVNAADEL